MVQPIERFRKAWHSRAPMEIGLTILGYATYGVAAVSVFAMLLLIVNFGDPAPGFPAGEGFLTALKGYGIGLFGAAAVVCYLLGRWLLEVRVPGAQDEIRSRYEASRLATDLAGEPEFQSAGTWEWRRRVAYDLVPELGDYAESEDWADRRFAEQTLKEAWEIYLRSTGS